MTELSPNVDMYSGFGPGLRHVPGLCVIPHFDRIQEWVPDILERYLAACPPDVTLIGIDEDTAIVGTPGRTEWTVMGRQSIHVFDADGATLQLDAGARFGT